MSQKDLMNPYLILGVPLHDSKKTKSIFKKNKVKYTEYETNHKDKMESVYVSVKTDADAENLKNSLREISEYLWSKR